VKRKRHTEEQIIAILKEHEAGAKTADVCRKHGVSEATFYNWVLSALCVILAHSALTIPFPKSSIVARSFLR
jgi:transposase-like protein